MRRRAYFGVRAVFAVFALFALFVVVALRGPALPRAEAGPDPSRLPVRDRWAVGDVARISVSRTGTATVTERVPPGVPRTGPGAEIESVPLGARMDTCLVRCLEATPDGDLVRALVFLEDWARDDGDRLDPCLKWGFLETTRKGDGAVPGWRLRSSPATPSDEAKRWLDAWFGPGGARDDVRLREGAAAPAGSLAVGSTWEGTLASFHGGPGPLSAPGLCDPPAGTKAGFRLVNVEGRAAAQVRGEASWTLETVPSLPLEKAATWEGPLAIRAEADLYLRIGGGRGFRAVVNADGIADGSLDGKPVRLRTQVSTVVDLDFGGEMPEPPPAADAAGRAPVVLAAADTLRAGDRVEFSSDRRSDVRIAPVAVARDAPERLTRIRRAVKRREDVLEASEAGTATRRRVSIVAWLRDQNGAVDESIAGRTVVVTGDGAARRFTLEPTAPPASPGALRWLEAEYGPVPEAEVPLRRTIVPGRPVAVGTAWVPDAAGFTTRVRGERGLDPARATGVARLVAVEGNEASLEAEFWLPMKPGAEALGDPDLRWMRGAGMAVSVSTTIGLDGRPVSGSSSTRARILGRASRADGSSVNIAVEVVDESRIDVRLATPSNR